MRRGGVLLPGNAAVRRTSAASALNASLETVLRRSATRELKRQDLALPAIVFTAEHEPVQRELAESLSADAFLTKPVSPLELLDTIDRLVAPRA